MTKETPLYAITGLILWFVISLLFQTSAVDIEIMKVWGKDNYARLVDIYKSDTYKLEQSNAIWQLEAQIEQLANPIVDDWLWEWWITDE